MRISDWSSDVCSSDLAVEFERIGTRVDLAAPDLPGHGRSAHLPPGADYSFAGALHSVLDVADALGWERFALLGHSMGAGIASLLAAGAPRRVARSDERRGGKECFRTVKYRWLTYH